MGTIELIASVGGIGGVLAFLMFLSYRYLVGQLREERRHTEGRLTGIISDYNKVCREQANALQEQTLVTRELYMYLKVRNGGDK